MVLLCANKQQRQSPNKDTSILNNETVNTIGILVKATRYQPHRTAQYVHGWRIEEALLMGVSGYNTKSLTVDHSR